MQANSAAYGQPTNNMYVPQQSSFGGNQQPTYGNVPTQSFNNNQFNTQAYTNQPSILNPPSMQTFATGIPGIEVAQQALQQNIQRNPTPPSGWNDPPVLKASRPVSNSVIFFILVEFKINQVCWATEYIFERFFPFIMYLNTIAIVDWL